MRKLLMAVLAILALPAHGWELADMNAHVDETNFIVGNHCSATLISAKERLLLTNAHCVDDYFAIKKETQIGEDDIVSEIEVSTSRDVPVTQKTYEGHVTTGETTWLTTVEARSIGDDLALLKIKATTIPHTAETTIFGGEAILRGQTVYAVGNAFGTYDATLTKGIISSVTRSLSVGDVVDGFFFQMDAGIVGGNSGGSLYNEAGELIGVPAASVRSTHLGFSVPYTVIREFLSKNGYDHIINPTPEEH